ncbi:hypothetical protein GGR57DRAFT_520775 [Xylariaceae sp. FL1272]|nr:hypothetical protein GGR57DRAFT_520775 [Xylariaceae sp. FL1272]
MTTIRNAPWADGPFHLIETPSRRIKSDHFYLRAASDMAQAHNVLLRGLNSIILQGPSLCASKNANTKDTKDFLKYIHCWIKMVHHHHWVEETFIFPEVAKLSDNPKLMEEPQLQHETFQEGLKQLEEYAIETSPHEYRWNGPRGMQVILDTFTGDLTSHLYAEIEVLLKLSYLDSGDYKKTWAKAEEVAKRSGNISQLYDIVPMVLGCADKTVCGNDFPPFPWIMPYLVKYWFAAGNGAWRFAPCDFWGQPRPLQFLAD